jgi:putative addiction module component (TIGR02574 family)
MTAAIDIERLSPVERLELIGRLWDSLDTEDLQPTQAQRHELDVRMASADADLADSIPWAELRQELAHRNT